MILKQLTVGKDADELQGHAASKWVVDAYKCYYNGEPSTLGGCTGPR